MLQRTRLDLQAGAVRSSVTAQRGWQAPACAWHWAHRSSEGAAPVAVEQ
jgi:hypothetical protein